MKRLRQPAANKYWSADRGGSMTTNRIINISQRIFSFLLKLYPREHREEYASSMYQVFTDECRDAYSRKGVWGVVSLWLRVIPDLGYTSILEHLASPGASLGLMEPVPNAPLPWKGVFLVLLPGLVYMISQIAQLMGEPWYLTVYYRAAFILIIPVLVVWVITKKFPIWGLIPVGLLFRLVKEIGYQLITLNPQAFSTNPLLNAILSLARLVESNLLITAFIFLVVSAILAFVHFRKNKPTRSVKIWGLALLLVILARVVYDVNSISDSIPYIMYMSNDEKMLNLYMNANLIQRIQLILNGIGGTELMTILQSNLSYILYDASAIVLLVMLGTLFIRSHGFFTIFILVGYVLPTMVVGLPLDLENNPQMLFIVSSAVLIYRSLLSLIAPIWMSRTQPVEGKEKSDPDVYPSGIGCVHGNAILTGNTQQYSLLWVQSLVFLCIFG